MATSTSHLKFTNSSKHLLRKARKSSKRVVNEVTSKKSTTTLSDFDQIIGLERVSLSPNTQLFIGCKNGKDLTHEKRWIFVDKSKIEDDLSTYKNSSEFINFKGLIKKYPEKEMLLGTYSIILNERIEFYLCTTLKAKNEILLYLKKQHDDILAKILMCMNPGPRPWISLGSEKEVTGNMNFNNRRLFVVELQSLYPIVKTKPKFRIRTAKEYKNAYVEILPSGRISFNYIMRRCVDRSTQSTGYMVNKNLQTVIKTVAHKSTQYDFEIPENSISTTNKKISTFIGNIYEEISSQLFTNTNINNFLDEYLDLKKIPISISMLRPKEISSHQDIINCKNKKISCISWNSLISGVVAAAYVDEPSFCITNKQLPYDYDCGDKYLVLIWTYQNKLRPKLYLHAIREVTSLSFCPYNENILVGGCSNGQILVWDISNKLNCQEKRSSCPKPYYVQIMIEKLVNWIKRIPGEDHIFPIIISDLNSGHLTPVSSIVWLPPDHYISRYGRYEDSLEDQKRMQFMTSSLGGSRILVYDLIPEKKQETRKKVSRLAKQPSGLRTNKSILAEMKYNFNPKYQMKITDSSGQPTYHPIMKLIVRNERYKYECQNPETIDDMKETTYFKALDLLLPFDKTMNLMYSTGCGTLQIASWEGQNYDQGHKVNSERCKVQIFKVIHDGPILVCEANHFFPELLLTIGGAVLAIWDTSQSQVGRQSPLLWRKAKCRYLSGMWSYVHPLAFVMIRTDTYYEYWNLSILSNCPITSFKHKGTMLVKLYSDSKKNHVCKKTFILTDEVGAFKVFTLPSWEQNGIDYSAGIETQEFLKRTLKVKKYIEDLKQKCVAKQVQTVEKTDQPVELLAAPSSNYEDPKPIVKQKKSFRTEKVKQMQIKEEMHMRKEILAKKRIIIDDIKLSKKPLDKKIKIKKKLCKAKLMEHISTDDILKTISTDPFKVRRIFKVEYPEEKRAFIKKQYKDNYKEVERDVINVIKERPYTIIFDWNALLSRKTICCNC